MPARAHAFRECLDKLDHRRWNVAAPDPPRNASIREASCDVEHACERLDTNALTRGARVGDEIGSDFRMRAEIAQREVIACRLDPAPTRGMRSMQGERFRLDPRPQ